MPVLSYVFPEAVHPTLSLEVEFLFSLQIEKLTLIILSLEFVIFELVVGLVTTIPEEGLV